MLSESELDDLNYDAPFDARVTAAEQVDGVWQYQIVELDIGHATDELVTAVPAREGNARERNNQQVAVGTIVQAQFRGIHGGEPLWEFSHCCSTRDDCECYEGVELTTPALHYFGAGGEPAFLDLDGQTGALFLVAGAPAVAAPATVPQWVAAPATAASSGQAGQLAYDGSYLYVCTATNTWKRVAVAAW